MDGYFSRASARQASRDFDSREEYERFLKEVVATRSAARREQRGANGTPRNWRGWRRFRRGE